MRTEAEVRKLIAAIARERDRECSHDNPRQEMYCNAIKYEQHVVITFLEWVIGDHDRMAEEIFALGKMEDT